MGDPVHRAITPPNPERALVELVVEFANAPLPASPGVVEALFRAHPFAARSPFWRSIDPATLGEDDPGGGRAAKALAAFAEDRKALRRELAKLVSGKRPAHGVPPAELEQRLVEALTVELQTPACARLRLPLGQPVVRVANRRLTLGVEPFLTGVGAAILYGRALLLDAHRGFANRLAQCRWGECGRFFWRSRAREPYCCSAHARRAARAANLERVLKCRVRHKLRNLRVRGRPVFRRDQIDALTSVDPTARQAAAAELRSGFRLSPDERLGQAFTALGQLTKTEGQWLDGVPRPRREQDA